MLHKNCESIRSNNNPDEPATFVIILETTTTTLGTALAKTIICQTGSNERCVGTRNLDNIIATSKGDQMLRLDGNDCMYGLGSDDVMLRSVFNEPLCYTIQKNCILDGSGYNI